MTWVKTFKGYEDEVDDLDKRVNDWIRSTSAKVVQVQAAMAHEPGKKSGDVLLAVLYEAAKPG